MKKLTKNNILKFIELKKAYETEENEQKKEVLKIKIENFIKVINSDKKRFTKLYSYNLNNDEILYIL